MIKVFKLNDLIKYMIRIIILLVIAIYLTKTVSKRVKNRKIEKLNGKAMIDVIDDSLELIKLAKQDDNDEEQLKNWGKVVLNSEFSVIDSHKKEDEEGKGEVELQQNTDVNEVQVEQEKEEKIASQAETNVTTEVVANNVNPRYDIDYNGVKINNSTEYQLSDEILNVDSFEVKKGKAIIYHTHTCESYTPTELYNYESGGNFRTNDLEYSVAKVGDELTNQLLSYNWNVLHDKTYHDYPSYNGSYSRSLNTINKLVAENSDTDIVIDVHRDAIGDSSYAPKVKIGDEYASQLMFVIGTDVAIPEHKNWNQNLKFAIKVQQKANELYPGLFKPIILRNSAYNQYVSKAACIIEVGATGNTLEESMCSMKYLARVLNEL